MPVLLLLNHTYINEIVDVFKVIHHQSKCHMYDVPYIQHGTDGRNRSGDILIQILPPNCIVVSHNWI